eukprot:TRINITY_DN4728_c0_g1_i1.p1 TRINITY_DN4728_c0_g1~~TRINITY_DN4728_c0_g1_i1.p1  ORF type:complete len:108 (+),score=19.28 TRINITY_DN4728_c0_g1_i1:3-326(+)
MNNHITLLKKIITKAPILRITPLLVIAGWLLVGGATHESYDPQNDDIRRNASVFKDEGSTTSNSKVSAYYPILKSIPANKVDEVLPSVAGDQVNSGRDGVFDGNRIK